VYRYRYICIYIRLFIVNQINIRTQRALWLSCGTGEVGVCGAVYLEAGAEGGGAHRACKRQEAAVDVGGPSPPHPQQTEGRTGVCVHQHLI